MAKPPFLLPEPAYGPTTDFVLDKVFGPVDSPSIDNLLALDEPGSGSNYLDSDIALKVAMMETDGRPFAQKFSEQYDDVKSRSYTQTLDKLRIQTLDAIDRNSGVALAAYGDRGDVEGGVQAVQRAQEPDPSGTLDGLNAAAMYDLDNTTANVQWAKIRRETLEGSIARMLEKAQVIEADGTIKWTDGYTLNKEPFLAFLGTMLPARNTLDFTNVGEGVNPLSGWEAYKGKIEDFLTRSDRPVEEQLAEFEGIMAQLFAETDNPMLAAERAQAFIDPHRREAVKWALLFDAGDLASIGVRPALRAVHYAQLLAQIRKPIHILRDVGRIKEAGELAAAALADPSLAKKAGTTTTEAAQAASPFPGGQFDPSFVDGVAAETQQALAVQRARTLKPLEDLVPGKLIVAREEWTDAQKLAAQQKALTQFAGKARKVSEDETGFTLDIDIEIPDPQGIKRSPMSRALLAFDDANEKLKAFRSKPAGENADVDLQNIQAEIRYAEENLHKEMDNLVAARAELAQDIKDGLRAQDDGGPGPTEDQLNRLDVMDRIIAQPGLALDLDPAKPDMIPSVIRKRIVYTRNEFGELDSVEYSKSSRFLNSPGTRIHQQMENAVSDMRARNMSSTVILNTLREVIKNSRKGLSRSSERKVDQLLLHGDDQQKVYSVAELERGVVTPEGNIRLTTVGEVNAYYTARQLSDQLWHLKNEEIRRGLEVDGFRSLKVPDGHIFVDARSPSTGGSTHAYSVADGKAGKVTRAQRQEIKAGTLRFYRLKKPYKDGKGGMVDYALARESDLGDIPQFPLRYRTGHIAKVIDNTHFIGKIYEKVSRNGKDFMDERVVAFFDNFTDVAIWKAQNASKGAVVESATDFVKRGNGLDDLEARMFGGLYEGERSDVPIKWNLTGKEGQRVGAFESLEAYAGHVAGRLPTHIFKAKLITKFTESAKSWAKKNLPEKQTVLFDPNDWQSKILLDPKSKEYGYFKSFQDWLKDQMHVQDPESRWFANASHGIAEWIAPSSRTTLLDKAQDAISKTALNIGQKDVTSEMRALAFHATLGWFNFAQLTVQAMGVANLALMHPLKAMKYGAEYSFLRATYLTKNKQAVLQTLDAARLAGAKMDNAEMVAKLAAFQRSGLWQTTMSTADHASAIVRGEWPPMALVRSVADAGMVFYREGERMSRTIAWLMAQEEFAKGRKILQYSMTDIDTITRMSQKYVFNLDRSNRAVWQKGLVSIPTQFMQYMAKFTEHMFYKSNKMESAWTAAEKVKVGLGMPLMFGAAGVPLGGWLLSNITNWVQGKEIGGLGVEDPAVAQVLSDGIAGAAINMMMGADVEFATRVSPPEGVTSILADFATLFSEDPQVGDLILGAFGEIPDRTFRAIGRLGNLFRPENLENLEPAIMVEAASEVGMVISSFRNGRKADIMRETQALWVGKVVEFEGKKLQPLDPESGPSQILAQLAGFTPGPVADHYRMAAYNQIIKRDEQDAVKAILMLAQRNANSNFYDGEKGAKRMRTAVRMVLAGMHERQQQKVMAGVAAKLKEDGYAKTKELLTAMENYYNTGGDGTATDVGQYGSIFPSTSKRTK